MKLLNAFIYPATIAKIDNLKTLKQKEILARELANTIGSYYKNYLDLNYILTYKAYCYLLDKHYPNHQEKLPQFITVIKDTATIKIFNTYISKFIKGETININDVLSTFEFTNTVYYSLYNEKSFMYLNLLFKDKKLNGNLVIHIMTNTYFNYYNNVLYNMKSLNIDKHKELKHIVYNLNEINLPITIIDNHGYKLSYYNIKKDQSSKSLTANIISLYLYLLTCNTLPNKNKIDYYWNTLVKSFIDILGTEPLNEMLEFFKQATNSTKYYLNKGTLK